MRRALPILVAGVAVLLGARTILATDAMSVHLEHERVRLRSHFDSVLAELAVADVSHLRPDQRAARATLVGWLADYRDTGQFPLNDLGTDDATPIFRDSRGVLCAMAYLIDRSGRGDIVNGVARSRNTAYIAELSGDDRLVAWLDSTGLSEAEAARIQPSYGPPPPDRDVVLVERSYAVGSMLTGGASLVTVTANLLKPSRVGATAGLAIGAITLWREWHEADHYRSTSINGYNIASVGYEKDSRVRAFTISSGAGAVLAAVWAWTRGHEEGAAVHSRNPIDRISISRGRDPSTGSPLLRFGLQLDAPRLGK